MAWGSSSMVSSGTQGISDQGTTDPGGGECGSGRNRPGVAVGVAEIHEQDNREVSVLARSVLGRRNPIVPNSPISNLPVSGARRSGRGMRPAGGNSRALIGIPWEGNETFLHGVKVVGPQFPRPVGPGPIMSTPYPQEDEEDRSNSSTTAQPPTPVTPVLVPDTDGHVCRHLLWKCARVTNRPHPFKDSTTNPSTGQRGFVFSGRLLTSMAGAKTRERYNWCPTSTKLP